VVKSLIKSNQMNRETYLKKASEQLQKIVFAPAGLEIPNDVKISCGFAPSGNRGKRFKTLGVCHNRKSSKANINEIFISPVMDKDIQVLDVLSHELIHAIDDCKSGHGVPFKRIAKAIGLTGKMTSTVANEELREKLKTVSENIGKYPHDEIVLSNRKKQGVRNVKVECNGCEFSFRTSRKNLELINNWDCLACGEEMGQI